MVEWSIYSCSVIGHIAISSLVDFVMPQTVPKTLSPSGKMQALIFF